MPRTLLVASAALRLIFGRNWVLARALVLVLAVYDQLLGRDAVMIFPNVYCVVSDHLQQR